MMDKNQKKVVEAVEMDTSKNIRINELTFLLYANGHNELEPEIWQSVVDIQNCNIGKKITVAVQIAREEQAVVKFLRPDLCLSQENAWSGVRRYIFSEEWNTITSVLDNINMADPKSLYDFISWVIIRYPASRYILSITGHIYQFVGLCPDYSGSNPLMMGFPEISSCLQMVFEKFEVYLDILILDTCYASTVEIIYELGRYQCPRIKNILTYTGIGPLSGLPYANLLTILDDTITAPLEDVLCCLVDQIDRNRCLYGLIALRINCKVLELVKELFSKVAFTYLRCKESCQIELTPQELLSNYREDYPWSLYLKPIHTLLVGMIIAIQSAESSDKNILPIHILHQKIPDKQRQNLYGRLSFSKQSDWAALLCNLSSKELLAARPDRLEPIKITPNILAAFIHSSNEHLPDDIHKNIISQLINIKQWNFTLDS